MDLELLLKQLSEYQTKELSKAHELTKSGMDKLNFNEYRDGLFIFKKVGTPFFTNDEEDLLVNRFFAKLEGELAKEGVTRNKKANGEPVELSEGIISFSLDGLVLFKVYPKSSRYAVQKQYQDETEWLPSHIQKEKELTLEIELAKKEIELIEKLTDSPMYGLSKEFKKEEEAWLTSKKRGTKTGLFSKLKLSSSLLLNGKRKENAVENLKRKRSMVERVEEDLENWKLDEERKRLHDENLDEKKAKADAILAPYQLFST